MVQQHVALVDHREDVGVLPSPSGSGRAERRIAQSVEAGQVGQAAPARADPAAPAPRRCRRPSSSRLLAKQSDQLRRCRCLDLQPDDVAAPAPAELAFDELEMRPAALVVELELGVAREPDERRLEDRLPGKQLRQMRSDDLFEQHERVPRRVGRRTRRGRPAGTCTIASLVGSRRRPARAGDARFRLSDASSGNGRDASIASGVRTGSTCVAEVRAERRLMRWQSRRTQDADARARRAQAAARHESGA